MGAGQIGHWDARGVYLHWPNTWSCKDCHGAQRPHLAEGYCVDCWRKRHGLPPRRPGDGDNSIQSARGARKW